MLKNNLIIAEIIFLEFNHCKNYNIEKFKFFGKDGDKMGKVGRPKAEIPRSESLTLRFSKFEREKISRVAEKKNLTITEAILKGIDLLERDKPKKYKNLNKSKPGQNEPGVVRGNSDDD